MSTLAPLAVVTGVSRGIGRATAIALSRRGLRLCLISRDARASEATRSACLAAGAPAARIVSADFSLISAVERAAAEVLVEGAAPAVIVHNAGVVHRAPVETFAIDDWQEEMSVNLTAPFVLTRALLPSMRRAGSGRILFVASISSTLGTARQSAYCASKWGVVGFMKSLAEELSDSGLMTAAVLPGSVDTAMLAGSGFAPRMSADDVARTLTYLALDAPLAQNGGVVELFGV